MPLSEDEQRILQEIERNFYDSDPAFSRDFATKTLARHAGRNLKWAALGFLVALIGLIASFTRSLAVAFVFFLVMLACAFVVERNARRLGRLGLEHVSQRTGSLGDQLGERRRKMRERFRRDSED